MRGSPPSPPHAPGSRRAHARPAAYPPAGTEDGFGHYFAELVVAMAARYGTTPPDISGLDPATIEALSTGDDKQPVRALFGADGPAMVWLFYRCWARLYGTVTLEVFGHIHPTLVHTGVMFVATLRELGRDLGLGEDTERVARIGAGLVAQGVSAG